MTYLRQSLALGLFLLLSVICRSQTHIGISGGGGINDMVSLRASLPVQVKLSPSLSFRAGFVFTQQHNTDILRKLNAFRDYRRTTISYVGIPLQLQASLPFRAFSVYALAGPQINYGLSFSTSYLEEGIYGNERLDFEKLQVRRFDLGLSTGIGISANIRKDQVLFIEMLMLLNFYDIDADPIGEIYNEGKVFNLGFLFPIK